MESIRAKARAKMGTLRWLYEVSGRKKGYVLALTLIQGAAGCVGVLYALLLRDVVDSAVAKDVGAFRHYVVHIASLVVVQIGIGALIRWLSELARSDLENAPKQRIVDNILCKDYAAVSATHSAEWLNRITGDAPILLLDEATSALDDATERKLLENLRSLTDRTVVIVTHRHAALEVCNRVVRFDEGGVSEG